MVNIETVLKNSKTIAMIGVSSLKKKEDPKNKINTAKRKYIYNNNIKRSGRGAGRTVQPPTATPRSGLAPEGGPAPSERPLRSEEGRVGKEWRSRWSPYH